MGKGKTSLHRTINCGAILVFIMFAPSSLREGSIVARLFDGLRAAPCMREANREKCLRQGICSGSARASS